MSKKLNDLRQFLLKAVQFGYANPDKAAVTNEKDHSRTIMYEEGDWRLHDNFFGGEPYGGREVVFYKNHPVFIMVYYGKVNNTAKNLDAVYKFLQKALKEPPAEHPYRGPSKMNDRNLQYNNRWQGEIDDFSGDEEILEDGKQVYFAKYMGGLVDQRASSEI